MAEAVEEKSLGEQLEQLPKRDGCHEQDTTMTPRQG